MPILFSFTNPKMSRVGRDARILSSRTRRTPLDVLPLFQKTINNTLQSQPFYALYLDSIAKSDLLLSSSMSPANLTEDELVATLSGVLLNDATEIDGLDEDLVAYM